MEALKPLLQVEQLEAGYGDVQVLWGIDLEVKQGEIVALVGSNGAGKSTLLRVLSGLLRPSGGKIWLGGQDATNQGAREMLLAGIALVPEGRRLFAGMSVLDNLLMGAYVRTDQQEIAKDLEWIYELFPILKERRDQLAGKLSGGEQQMCAIARALLGRPKLLLLDELSLGLAPVIVDRILEVLVELKKQGITMLVVEQDVQAGLELADRGYVMEHGRIVLTGTGRALLDDPRVKEAYLGL